MLKNLVKNLKPSSTLAINETSRELEKKGKKIFKFGFGQSPFKVPEDIVQASVNELSRVTKGPIFATISLRLSKLDPAPPKTPFVHITVKRRRWWDARFAMAGCVPDTKLLIKL